MEEKKIVSGEEFRALKSHKKDNGENNKKILLGIAAVIYTLAIFFIGIAFQKHHTKTTTVSSTNGSSSRFGSGFSGQGGFNNPDRLFGSVTSVGPTSITVDNLRSGASTTVNITSSTTITDAGQTITLSSITTGETVMIALDPSNTTNATSVSVFTPPSSSSSSSSSNSL